MSTSLQPFCNFSIEYLTTKYSGQLIENRIFIHDILESRDLFSGGCACERARLLRLGDELGSVAAAQPQQRRRPEQRRVDAREPLSHLAQHLRHTGGVRPGREDGDEMADRRVPERRPPLELLREESGHVVPLRELEGHRVRLERLHDHEARARRGRCVRRAG